MKADFEKGVKICSKCKKELPISEFSKNKATKDRLNCYCKKCASRKVCDYVKSEKGRRKRKEYYSLEYIKEKNRKRGNKIKNTFSGTERNCRGKSRIVKRDYELTEEQLQKREMQRKGHKTRNKEESVHGLLVWYDGQLNNLDKREYKNAMDREYSRQRRCAVCGSIGVKPPSEHFLFDFDLEQMLKDKACSGSGYSKIQITKWWDGEIRHWTVNDGIWKK